MMWLHFALIFLAGTALVDSQAEWKPNHIYRYIVRSRALTGVQVSDQVSGVLVKGQFNVYVESPDVWTVELTEGQYASIHTSLPDGWNVHIPDNKLKYVAMPTTRDPVKVTLHNGKIKEVFTSLRDSTNPQTVNIIKGILSHIQFETGKLTQKQIKRIVGDNYSHQVYTAKEQTVSGYCKTEYDIAPIFREDIRKTNVPYLEASSEDGYIKVSKYKNYKDCLQESDYQFAVTDDVKTNVKQNYITRLSLTNMIVSYKKEYFTVWSSVMENVIQVKPKVEDMESSKMFNMMNLTLVKVEEGARKGNMPNDMVSNGNLTYNYDMREKDTVETSFFYDMESLKNMRGSAESDVHSTLGRNQGRYSKRSKHSSEENSSESSSQEYGYLNSEMYKRAASRVKSPRDYTPPDMIKQINSIIHDVATEITTPDEIVNQGTLEKYTILTRIFRYMNETSLTAVRDKLEIERRAAKSDERKAIAYNVFHNALAQTGTFAAFKVIHTIVTTKSVTNLEAALLLGQLPRAVRHPTPKYIQQFYELIKSPEVKNQVVLNTTAPYAFSEIVRYALVLNQKYTYPISPETDVKTEEREKLVSTYISYFANELEKAYKAKHDDRIVTYIMALGNIGHSAVIRVFEPYLEGKYRLTTFQRTIMVNALGKVYPGFYKVVGPIVYKIYQNQEEHYQVRVMALKVLFKNNPPEYVVVNIAKKVSEEYNVQVKNAVLTGIDSLTKLKGEKYESLVRSAIAASRVLRSRDQQDRKYNIRYSTNTMVDYVNKKKDYYASFVYSTIGSETKSVPKFVDVAFKYNYSSFSPPAFRTQYGLSDINAILSTVKKIIGRDTNVEQSTVDELGDKLNIVYNEVEPEGNFVLSDEHRVFLVVFDRYTLRDVVGNLIQLTQSSHEYKKHRVANIFNRQFVISYPSEIGLSVNYRSATPELISIRNKLRIKGKNLMDIDHEIDIVVNKKAISRITFITPFSDEQYFAGVDVDWQLRVPVAWSTQLDLKEKQIEVEVKSIVGTEKAKLWQYHVLPYSGKAYSPNFKSVHTDKNTQPIIIGEIKKSTTDFVLGKIIVKQETDSFVPNIVNNFKVSSPVDVFENILNAFVSTPFYYQKQEISLNYKPGRSNNMIIKANYSYTALVNYEEKTEDLEKEYEELWTQSETKIQQAFAANFFKVQFLVPDDNIDYTCFGSTAQFYLSTNTVGKCYLVNSSKVTNVCGYAVVRQVFSGCPTMDLSSNKIRPFKVSIRYGESCKNGKEISVKGLQKQNENVKEEIINSKTYEQSKKEIAENNFGLVNAEKVCKVIDFMDELMFSVKMDPQNIKAIHVYALKWLLNKVIPNANIRSLNSETSSFKFSNFIDSTVKRQFQNNKMNVTLTSGSLALEVPTEQAPIVPFENFINYELDSFWGIQNNRKFCTLGKTRVKTFDNKVYPIEINEYLYVMMINPEMTKHYLYKSPYNLDKSPATSNHNIGILFENRSVEDGKRQIVILYKNKKFYMKTSDNAFYVNGKPLKFSKFGDVAFPEKNLDVKVAKLTSVLYEITVEPAEVVVWFDGEHVKIQASDAYNGQVRGLCGTKDDNVETDFTIPQGCVVKKPKDFIAFYTSDSDKWVVDEKLRKEALEKCRVIEYRQTKVVADATSSEEGISSQESTEAIKACTMLRTDIEMDDKHGKACFSMRPIPICAEGCKKWLVTKKPIAYHCDTVTPEINKMIERIKAGANPDFSTKTPNMVKHIPLPKMCHPE